MPGSRAARTFSQEADRDDRSSGDRSETAIGHRHWRRSAGGKTVLTCGVRIFLTGIKNVVIPRKGKPAQARRVEEHRKAFRCIVKWRTGSEGRISHLKRSYGWDRTRIDGTEGTRIWTGHGILAHNLVKISALAA